MGASASVSAVLFDVDGVLMDAAAVIETGAYCVGIGGDDLLGSGARITIPDLRTVRVIPLAADPSELSCTPGHRVEVLHGTRPGDQP